MTTNEFTYHLYSILHIRLMSVTSTILVLFFVFWCKYIKEYYRCRVIILFLTRFLLNSKKILFNPLIIDWISWFKCMLGLWQTDRHAVRTQWIFGDITLGIHIWSRQRERASLAWRREVWINYLSIYVRVGGINLVCSRFDRPQVCPEREKFFFFDYIKHFCFIHKLPQARASMRAAPTPPATPADQPHIKTPFIYLFLHKSYRYST